MCADLSDVGVRRYGCAHMLDVGGEEVCVCTHVGCRG